MTVLSRISKVLQNIALQAGFGTGVGLHLSELFVFLLLMLLTPFPLLNQEVSEPNIVGRK